MASEVEICCLALAHLGDSATVASIDPPEGSSQAEHCARFYPIARDELLEMHDWSFATLRVALAQVANSWPEWTYAYARPSDALKIIAVLDANAPADYSGAYPLPSWPSCYGGLNINQIGVYTPQTFACETDSSGNEIIFTNQVNAVARYKRGVTDTSKFSALFTSTLARLLASYLAGPILKGDSGIAQGKAQMAIAMGMLPQAKLADGAQQRQDTAHSVPWLAGR